MQGLKKYWSELEVRERLVLIWGSICVALILFYALLLQPLYKANAHMESVLPVLRSNLVWMQQSNDLLEQGGRIPVNQNAQGANESLLSVIESTARSANVRKSIQQMVPDASNNEVRVVLEEANFNQWLRWVDTLYKRYNVNIRQVTADRDEDKPNIAEVRVTFYREN